MVGKNARHPDVEPAHPGEFLDEIVIPATGRSKTEIAKLLGVFRHRLYDLLRKEQGVTSEMALRLGKLFGDGPQIWPRMQIERDLWRANRENAAAIAKIPTLSAA